MYGGTHAWGDIIILTNCICPTKKYILDSNHNLYMFCYSPILGCYRRKSSWVDFVAILEFEFIFNGFLLKNLAKSVLRQNRGGRKKPKEREREGLEILHAPMKSAYNFYTS